MTLKKNNDFTILIIAKLSKLGGSSEVKINNLSIPAKVMIIIPKTCTKSDKYYLTVNAFTIISKNNAKLIAKSK